MCRNCDNFGICQNKCVPPTEVEFSNARIPAVEIPSDSSLESELNASPTLLDSNDPLNR